jgi:hypothetical protein
MIANTDIERARAVTAEVVGPCPVCEHCSICGCAPCGTLGFCQMCREADRKAAAQHRATKERRPTPRSTIDAILYCVRTRGLAALKEPANLERLRRCDAKVQAEIDRRIDKLFELGILEK